ncbi:MAG: hypothetical protein ACK41T_08725 [Pseudobdellovibrio sp.]
MHTCFETISTSLTQHLDLRSTHTNQNIGQPIIKKNTHFHTSHTEATDHTHSQECQGQSHCCHLNTSIVYKNYDNNLFLNHLLNQNYADLKSDILQDLYLEGPFQPPRRS